MNIDKVGNFISERRKAKKLTQEKLAEKLNISDRAISKWERGICLPDASIMIPLCEILDINVNELLSGEMLNEKEYNKKSEELLLELKRLEEEPIQIAIILVSLVLLLIACLYAVKIESLVGYHECKLCHHKHKPSYKEVLWAMHFGTTRYLRSPKCNKKSWNKKVISK